MSDVQLKSVGSLWPVCSVVEHPVAIVFDDLEREIFPEVVGLTQWLRIGLGIYLRDLDFKNVSIADAANSFCFAQLFAVGHADDWTVLESVRLHHQSFPFPVADRIPHG